jgi:hypothetical protein
MPTIHVAKAFILSLDSGEKLSIGVGRHQVSDEVAQHWYTQAHLFGVYTGPTSRPTAPNEVSNAGNVSVLRYLQQDAERRRRETEQWMQRRPDDRWRAWERFAAELNDRIAFEELRAEGIAEARRRQAEATVRRAAEAVQAAERRAAAKQRAEQQRHERELEAFAKRVAGWRQQLPGMCNPNLIIALDREIAEFEHDWLDPDEAEEVANIAAGVTWRQPGPTVH